MKEQLHVTKDVGGCLANVLRGAKYHLEAETYAWERRRELLLEKPLLRYSEDVKLMDVDLSKTGLVNEILDEELGEGLTWPKSTENVAGEIMKTAGTERLQMKTEIVDLIKAAVKNLMVFNPDFKQYAHVCKFKSRIIEP